MFPTSVAGYTVVVVLVIAVAEHVRAPRALPDALRAHGMIRGRATGFAATAVTAVEALLAVALLMRPSAPLFAAAGLVFAGYAAYSWHVVSSGRGGPCGCGGVEVPMGTWVIVRAGVLAALSAVAVAGPPPTLSMMDVQLVVELLAALVFGVLLWHLPAAMAPHPEVAR
ncbi:MauE/DoxX family redox-associated membrane protein [Actinokineospora guangxiensis]|uniref:MauE/DoxX family redox-associated membrane protein n=1 Tax=Actinokineospora guangxiensis TaxID=1490288 RepID=A0ABW0EU76_9PSEU